MRFLVRILQVIVAVVVAAAVVLWFAARRGDRGMIEEEVTITRPAATVFHWISSEDLARRWISDVVELRKLDSNGTAFHLEELVDGHTVGMDIRVVRSIPGQELGLLISSGGSGVEGFSGDASFKLLANGEYTRLSFTSHTQFVSWSDRMLEPVLTIAMQQKMRDDLAKLKILLEAESEKPASPRGTQ